MKKLFKNHPTLLTSYLYITEKHKGQHRMGGLPYVTHPVAVATILMDKGYPLDSLKLALYHDLFEDTDATEQEILELSNEHVVLGVHQLTKVSPVDMPTYLAQMGHLAKPVKLADRLHNLLSAIVAPIQFRRRYIAETEKYYLNFARGTDFELDITQALDRLKKTIL